MPKKSDISQEDIDLFRDNVKDATPLGTPKKSRSFQTQDHVDTADYALFYEGEILDTDINAGTSLSFYKSGLQQKQLKKLRLGQLTVESRIDLHGLTVHEANIELSTYLQSCIAKGTKVFLLIHGKGAGTIKNQVNRWLRSHPAVLAFHSALPKDGGTGALYVILKSSK